MPLPNIIPMFVLQMPPPHRDKQCCPFPALFSAYKETTKATAMGLFLSKLSPAQTSLCKLLESLKPQREHRWPKQAGKMQVWYSQTRPNIPHGKTWLIAGLWKAECTQMPPSKKKFASVGSAEHASTQIRGEIRKQIKITAKN